jgi:hypothetical protein
VPGTLYPGLHFVVPLVEDVALFDTRDQVFTTGVSEDGKKAAASVSSKSHLLDTRPKRDLPSDLRLRCVTASILKGRTTFKATCLVRGEGDCSPDRG